MRKRKGPTKGYRYSSLSDAQIAQRHSAVLTRRRKRMRDGKEVSVKDAGKLKVLDRLCEGDKELESIYRQVIVDAGMNPSKWLIKKLAETEIRLKKHERQNPGNPISAEFLATVKVSNELVKTHIKAIKELDPKRRRVMSEQALSENDVIDVDFEKL